MISASHKFIFVHIPKTGGNSLQNSLKPYSEDRFTIKSDKQDGIERFAVRHENSDLLKHASLEDYRCALAPAFFSAALKFTIVRNTWDRMISRYFFKRSNPPYHEDDEKPAEIEFDPKRLLRIVKKRPNPVASFICCEMPDGTRAPIAQHSIDRFIRFERLQADFDCVTSALGIRPERLVQRNASFHRPYFEYYTPALRDEIGRLYAEEIGYFDFRFGA